MYLQKLVKGLKYTDLRKNWKNLMENLEKVYYDEIKDLADTKTLAKFFKLKKELLRKKKFEREGIIKLEKVLKEMNVI